MGRHPTGRRPGRSPVYATEAERRAARRMRDKERKARSVHVGRHKECWDECKRRAGIPRDEDFAGELLNLLEWAGLPSLEHNLGDQTAKDKGSNLSHDQVVGVVPTTRLHSRSMMCEDGGDDNDEDDEEEEEEEEEDDEYVEDRGQNKWSGKASGALNPKNGTNSYHNAETGQAGTSQCRKKLTRRKADTLHCDREKGVKEEKASGNTVRFVDRQEAEASVVGVDNKPVTRRGTCVTVHRPGSGKKKGSTLEADGLPALFHCTHPGCEKVYRVKEYLSNHVKAVHGARRHVCPQPGCGKRFVLQRHLRKHLVLHSEERNFLCATCGASFKSKKNLLVHLRIHTGEKPLQCELCGYRCRQKASLNWHMKKHNVESNFTFACGLCGKRFEKSDNLRCHQLKSHPDREQSSPACQINFPVMADRLSETSTPLSST